MEEFAASFHDQSLESNTRMRLLERIEELRHQRTMARANFEFEGIALKSVRAQADIMLRADKILEESRLRIPTQR